MSAAKIFLVFIIMVVAGEATFLPLIKAFIGKDNYNYNLGTSDFYTQDDCNYPNGYYYSGHNGYPSGYYGYPSEYYGYNGYGRGYTGHNGYPRRYYGYTGYPRGYNGYKEYYPRGYYSGYSDVYHQADKPRQGKTWSELCPVHYPDSIGAPGKAGVVCL